MSGQKRQLFTRQADVQQNLYSPPLMCVGLVISWANFSLARNLRNFEYEQTEQYFQTVTENRGLNLPAEVILLSDEAVVDVTNK